MKGHNVYSAALVPNQVAPYQVNQYSSSSLSQVQVVESVVSGGVWVRQNLARAQKRSEVGRVGISRSSHRW